MCREAQFANHMPGLVNDGHAPFRAIPGRLAFVSEHLLLPLLLLEHAPPLRRREPIHRYRGTLCRRGYGKSSVASRAPGWASGSMTGLSVIGARIALIGARIALLPRLTID